MAAYVHTASVYYLPRTFSFQQQDGIVWLVSDVLDIRDVFAIV